MLVMLQVYYPSHSMQIYTDTEHSENIYSLSIKPGMYYKATWRWVLHSGDGNSVNCKQGMKYSCSLKTDHLYQCDGYLSP